MKEEQGKKLDPNDPAIPAKPDKPTALPDEDLDKVAGGITGIILNPTSPPSGGNGLKAPPVGVSPIFTKL